MGGILNGIYFLLAVFAVLTLIYNFEPRLQRFPWDMIVDKFGFRLYFPVTTAFVAAMALLFVMKFFKLSF